MDARVNGDVVSTAAGADNDTSRAFTTKSAPTYQRMLERRRARGKKVSQSPSELCNDWFPYMGIDLVPQQDLITTSVPAPSDGPEKENSFSLPSFSLPSSKCRLLRLSVENGVEATGAELFKSIQRGFHSSSSDDALPHTINVKGQSYSVQYVPPHGDELLFGRHSQDTQWIGDKCVGTVLIRPLSTHLTSNVEPSPAFSDHTLSEWQNAPSFPSWHRPSPSGIPSSG